MPKPTKPEIELAVAGQKAKASTYNDNMQSMLDYVDECMDYAVLADLSNLDETGEAYFVKPDVAVTHTTNTAVGSSSNPVYVNSSGNVVACSSIDKSLLSAIPSIIKSYKSGHTCYRIWSDGFKEVWGYSKGDNTTITFPNTGDYAFTNLNSIHIVTGIRGKSRWDGGGVNYSNETDCIPTVTLTGFTISQIMDVYFDWYASGF